MNFSCRFFSRGVRIHEYIKLKLKSFIVGICLIDWLMSEYVDFYCTFIPGWLEAVNQRKTDNALTKRNKWSGQTIIEQQKPEVNKGASEWSAVGGLLVTPVVLNLLTTSVGKSSIKKEPVYDYDKWDLYKVICNTYTL
jgi:hypothetical protein